MLSINTNLSSLIAQNSMKTSTNKLNQAVERMSTGYKINHAKDNAANYSIATNMTTKIGAYMVAEDNALQGLDMINTASESLTLIEDKLMRLRALATQASNGTYGTQSLNAINAEAGALVDEINRLYNTTEYNGNNIFKSEFITEEALNRPVAGSDGFINTVAKRDTSTMTSLSSVSANSALTDGTYSISTVEELQKLAEMTNNGYVSTGDEFVLANDIDLSNVENWIPIGNGGYRDGVWTGKSFTGKFDGNGFTISNMKLISEEAVNKGLFGYISSSGQVKNLAVIDAKIKVVGCEIGIISGVLGGSGKIYNCYTTGNVTTSEYCAGGIVGCVSTSAASLSGCYSSAIVQAGDCAGGIAGSIYRSLSDCFFEGEVYALATDCTGGITGRTQSSDIIIENCYVNIKNEFSGGVFVGYVNPSTQSITINNSSYNTKYTNPLIGSNNRANAPVTLNNVQAYSSEMKTSSLQIGICAEASSQIAVDVSFSIAGVNLFGDLKSSFFDNYYLKNLDAMLERCSEKQTELGAVQNRLESALDEIATQYENLVSSRSTLRDADLSEESASYIQAQILQQAAATLMSTANQSPAIALQLI